MLRSKHTHYFKNVEGLDEIDIYRMLQLFDVTDQCFGHAVKKILVAGGRGAGKDQDQDVQEAIDTLLRWQEMRMENRKIYEHRQAKLRELLLPQLPTPSQFGELIGIETP